MKLYQVTSFITKDEKTATKMDSFIVADNINQVIKDLQLDLEDAATNIIGINEIAPILKIINKED